VAEVLATTTLDYTTYSDSLTTPADGKCVK